MNLGVRGGGCAGTRKSGGRGGCGQDVLNERRINKGINKRGET